MELTEGEILKAHPPSQGLLTHGVLLRGERPAVALHGRQLHPHHIPERSIMERWQNNNGGSWRGVCGAEEEEEAALRMRDVGEE
ncbi:hypothetical protein EYF80_040282 [Liparis tanakae]|uniref:Uncharacterized protein n=1 Tax=Liparis tanakae TaxID=230148 RepID=A0A4Z2GAD4_9TELE|nr:hypothetical protein EYF80_040282 [Liparis tanakae]